MELLVDEVGLTPIETLTAATRNNAMAIGIEDSHGTLEPGKVADIVIVDSDPTGSLPGVSQIVMVIKNGRIVGRRSGGRP
jgi:imidazolonepropionase-like amidohydrolase